MIEFFAQLKKARLFGHPIHAIFVHFPSALFPMSWLFDVLGVWLQNSCLSCAAFFSLAAGLVLGLVATLFGAIDYVRLSPEHVAWNKASLHAVLSIAWLCLFGIVFGLRLKTYPAIPFASMIEIVLSTIGVIGLIFSNFLGGDLVFRHKLGINDKE